MTLLYIGGEHQVFVAELSFNMAQIPSLEVKQAITVGAMPSFLAFSPTDSVVLAVAESADALVSMRLSSSGELTPLSAVMCPGGPAYVSIDSSGCFAFTASYGSGETRCFRISGNGELSAATSVVQTGMFSHCAVPCVTNPKEFQLVSASKGTDSLARMLLRPETGTLSLEQRVSLPAGSGPRHLVFSPNGELAYVSGENDCSLMVIDCSQVAWELCAHEPGLSGKKQDSDSGADVHLSADGRFAYLSLRGEDSLLVYRCMDGALQFLQRESTRGRVPRNFCLIGDELLIAANQESANLSVFSRDKEKGTLEYRGTLETPERAFWVGNRSSR